MANKQLCDEYKKIMLLRSKQVLKKHRPYNPCMYWTVYAKQQASAYLSDNTVSHPYTIPELSSRNGKFKVCVYLKLWNGIFFLCFTDRAS